MNKTSKNFLADMTNAISPSGYEHCAAAVWKAYAKPFADRIETDVHGNSHAVINAGGKVKVNSSPLGSQCFEVWRNWFSNPVTYSAECNPA